MKLYKGLVCPLDNYELLLFSLTGGADGKTYPFCECCMCLSARGACSSLMRLPAVREWSVTCLPRCCASMHVMHESFFEC